MPNAENLKGKGFKENPQNINKAGRPKKLPDLDTLLADVLGEETDGKTAAQEILESLHRQAKKGNVRAAEVLLERGYGKPKQEVDQKTVIYSVDVTPEEANDIAKEIFKDI